VQDLKPARRKDAVQWVREEVAAQKKRHAAIMKEMNEDLAPKRAKWYQEFLQIVQTKGFNFNGDSRRVIKGADVPKKPKRPDKVVW
jgi:hypothetical protein